MKIKICNCIFVNDLLDEAKKQKLENLFKRLNYLDRNICDVKNFENNNIDLTSEVTNTYVEMIKSEKRHIQREITDIYCMHNDQKLVKVLFYDGLLERVIYLQLTKLNMHINFDDLDEDLQFLNIRGFPILCIDLSNKQYQAAFPHSDTEIYFSAKYHLYKPFTEVRLCSADYTDICDEFKYIQDENYQLKINGNT